MMQSFEEKVEVYNQLANEKGIDVKSKCENLGQYLVSPEQLENLHQKFYGNGNKSYKTILSDNFDNFHRKTMLDIDISNITIIPDGEYVSGLIDENKTTKNDTTKNESNAIVHFDSSNLEHAFIEF